jgi:chromosomal replication initiation ATPase DnaA
MSKKPLVFTVNIKHSLELCTESVSALIHIISDYYNVDNEWAFTPSRKHIFTDKRSLAFKILNDQTDEPRGKVGKQFGNRDHTTVIYGSQTAENRVKYDKKFAKDFNNLTELYKAKLIQLGKLPESDRIADLEKL